MAKQTFVVTREGYEKYQEELRDLKLVQYPAVKQKLAEARAQGDLSENAEYDAARDLQGRLWGRIQELETILDGAQIVENTAAKDEISIGCVVKLHDVTYDEDLEYTIVGPTEANMREGKISNESPIGKELLNHHKVGDTIVITTMDGEKDEYKILDFHR